MKNGTQTNAEAADKNKICPFAFAQGTVCLRLLRPIFQRDAMTKRFPLRIHRREQNGAVTFLATTALAKLADDPDRTNALLRDFAAAYTRALARVRDALAEGKRARGEKARRDARVGQAIQEFENTLGAAGFYLFARTETFARDLGVNAGWLRKMIAFQRKTPSAGRGGERKSERGKRRGKNRVA